MKVLVAKYSIRAFENEIARLNKRAVKVGFVPLAFVRLAEKTVTRNHITVSHVDGEEQVQQRSVPVDVVEYELSLPSVEDYRWTMVATITSAEGLVFVDAHVPGVDTDKWGKADPCRCEHCNVNRNRTLTYVVRNKDDGRELQVGRTCFADYVGHEGLLKLEFLQTVVSMFSGEGDEEGFYPGSGGGRQSVTSVRQVLAIAELLAQQNGWKNNVKDEEGHIVEDGTHRQAARYANSFIPGPQAAGIWARFHNQEDDVWQQVENILQQLKDLEPADDFATSLRYCAGFDFVPDKKAGLIAYGGQYLRNAQRRAALDARKATMKHIGTVGARLVLTLKCTRVNRFEGEFGVTYFNNFEDAEGNLVLWKTGTFVGEEGKEYTMKATIKAHSEWKGGKQTEISRAKVQ